MDGAPRGAVRFSAHSRLRPLTRNAGDAPSPATCTSASPDSSATSSANVDDYNYDRPHHGRLTQGRIPADIVYGANKVNTR